MVKENITTSELHGKKDGFVIRMSSELMAYLCNDYAYRNPNRFSRLKALQDLLIRYQEAKQSSSQMNVNIAILSRPGDGAVLLCWLLWSSSRSWRSWRYATW